MISKEWAHPLCINCAKSHQPDGIRQLMPYTLPTRTLSGQLTARNHSSCQSKIHKTLFIFRLPSSPHLHLPSFPSSLSSFCLRHEIKQMRAKLEDLSPEERAAVQHFKTDITIVFNDLYEDRWDQERWDRAVGKQSPRPFSFPMENRPAWPMRNVWIGIVYCKRPPRGCLDRRPCALHSTSRSCGYANAIMRT